MLTAGGLSLFLSSVLVGDLIADAIDRYVAGVDPASTTATLPDPYNVDNPIPKYNNDVVAMAPSLARVGWQGLFAIAGIAAGALVASPALKLLFYGLGGGAVTHLGSQIITAYVIVPMNKASTGTGLRMYQHEINVYNALANPTGGILGRGPANRPRRVGEPPAAQQHPEVKQLPANQPKPRIPVALASQVQPQAIPAPPNNSSAAPAPLVQQAANPAVGSPPAGHVAGCKCSQCPQPKQEPAPSLGGHPLGDWLLTRHAA